MSRNAATNDGGDNAAAVLSIERKLELLESRFTQPANGALLEAATAPASFPSTSSPSNDRSNSEHSFSFPATLEQQKSTSNLCRSAVRSRRRPSLKNTLHAVEMATSRHMRKVAANSPIQGTSANANTSSSFGGMSSNSSSQTLLTSHVHHRVVAETPPVIVSPHNRPAPTTPKPAAARNILLNPHTGSNHSNKAFSNSNSVSEWTASILRMNDWSQSVSHFGLTLLFLHLCYRNANPFPNGNTPPSRIRASRPPNLPRKQGQTASNCDLPRLPRPSPRP
jgi:hypothetical protein